MPWTDKVRGVSVTWEVFGLAQGGIGGEHSLCLIVWLGDFQAVDLKQRDELSSWRLMGSPNIDFIAHAIEWQLLLNDSQAIKAENVLIMSSNQVWQIDAVRSFSIVELTAAGIWYDRTSRSHRWCIEKRQFFQLWWPKAITENISVLIAARYTDAGELRVLVQLAFGILLRKVPEQAIKPSIGAIIFFDKFVAFLVILMSITTSER